MNALKFKSVNPQPMTAARAALAEAVTRHASARALAEEAAAPSRRLRIVLADAEQAVQTARDALAGIDVAEAADLQQWAATGNGRRPDPCTAERRLAEQAVVDAERHVEAIRTTLASADGRWQASNADAQRLGQEVRERAHDVIEDEANAAASKYLSALHAAAAAAADIEAAHATIRAGFSDLSPKNGRVRGLRGLLPFRVEISGPGWFLPAFGRDAAAPVFTTEPAEINAATHRWTEFAARLVNDATAELGETK